MIEYIASAFMILLCSATLIDALRHRNSLMRPEFYLLVSIFAYGIPGYLTYRYMSISSAPFMMYYTHTTELIALLYTTLAIMGVYFGGQLYRPVPDVSRFSNAKPFVPLVWGGGIAVFIGIAINYVILKEVGAFSGHFQHIDFIAVRSNGFYIPYIYILMPGFAAIALYSRRSRYVWLLFAAFAIPNLIAGSRRESLILFIAILVARILRGVKISKRWLLIVLAIGLVGGVMVGATRGHVTINQAVNDKRLLLYPLTEYVRPFSSLLFYIEHPKQDFPGQTFYNALVATVPSAVLPGEKLNSPGVQFKNELALYADYNGETATGQGFSPVAEALINFTAFGIPVFFFVISMLLRFWGREIRNGKWALFNCVLCASMYNIGRGGFFTQIPLLIYTLIITFIILVLARGINKLTHKRMAFFQRGG